MTKKIGFIGIGLMGLPMSKNILKAGYNLTAFNRSKNKAEPLKEFGAKISNTPREIAEEVDLVITCLPSPEICSDVMESKDGVIQGLSSNKIWLEMSTTDESEVKRLGDLVMKKNAIPLDGPVSGGCHRAATGNIAIFVGGQRSSFEKILPVLKCMGRKILHTGDLGSASVLKVITNYLASVHLAAIGEAWAVAKKSNLNLEKTFKGIGISSGNSFVHETESQVILNGSYNINFTMDLVEKDMTLFNDLSKKLGLDLEISPFILDIFKDAKEKFGSRAWSSMVVKRLENKYNIDFRALGFPEELIDNEAEEKGYEI